MEDDTEIDVEAVDTERFIETDVTLTVTGNYVSMVQWFHFLEDSVNKTLSRGPKAHPGEISSAVMTEALLNEVIDEMQLEEYSRVEPHIGQEVVTMEEAEELLSASLEWEDES